MLGAWLRRRRGAVSCHHLRALRLRSAAVFVCLLTLAGAAQRAHAASPGGLDPSFGVGGVALTSIGDGNAQATAVAPDPDGGVVAGGSAVSDGALGFALARYSAAGTLETAFGSSGTLTANLGHTTSQVNAVTVESNGDILVAGSGDTSGGSTEVLLALYSPSGQLVSGFGTGGSELVAIGNGGNAQANAIVLNGSNVLVAGRAVNGAAYEEFYEAFNAGTGAAVSSTKYLGSFGNGTDTEANAIALDGSDVLLAGFTSTTNGYKEPLVTELSTAGALQTSFGDSGVAALKFGMDAEAQAVAVQSSGRIVIDGSAATSQGVNEVMLAGLKSTGAIDTSFGDRGVNVLAIGSGENASASTLALDSSGDLLVAGQAADSFQSQAARLPLVARFTPGGELDTSFAASGSTPGAVLLECNSDGGFNTGYVDSSGDFVVGGHSGADANHQAFLLARYTTSSIAGSNCAAGSGSGGSGGGSGGESGGTGGGSGGGAGTGSGGGGASGTGPAGCAQQQRQFGVLIVKACFEREGVRYLASGSISLDGLSIEPSPCTVLVFDPVADTIISACNQGGPGEVAISAPTGGGVISGIPLYRGALDWSIPTTDGGDLGELDVGSFAELEGFPMIGQVDPTAGAGGTLDMPLTISLPSPFDSVTGSITLTTQIGQPVSLGGLSISVPEIWLGPLDIQSFNISYDAASDTWTGSAQASFASPLDYSIGAGAAFTDGSLSGLSAEVSFGDPGIPLGSTGVFLQELNFGIFTHPLKIEGGLGIDVADVFDLQGDLTVLIPPGGWDIRIDGSLAIGGVSLASAYLEIDSNGTAFFGGGINYGSCDEFCVQANAGGWIDLSNSTFDAYAGGQVSVLSFPLAGADVNVSSKAIAVCGEASWAIVSFSLGGAYVYGQGFSIMGGADVAGAKIGNGGQCDLSSYELTQPTPVIGAGGGMSGSARTGRDGLAAAVTSDQMTVKPHTRGLVWRLRGSGAAPQVLVTGPGGVQLASAANGSPVKTSSGLIIQDPSTDATYVVLAMPKAGHWLITPQGTSTIASISTADVLPEPKVTAHVGGKALKRVLNYTLKPIPGQSVRFLETAKNFSHVIGTVTKDRGSVRFTPAPGPSGQRTIVAQVMQGISIRRQLKVASYAVPASLLVPQAPTHLTARRHGAKLLLSWHEHGSASFYVVQSRASGGQTTVAKTKGASASVRLAPVYGAAITVTPRTSYGEQGKSATVKVPAPTQPKRTKAPNVSGSARVGQRLTCKRGSFSGHPTRYVIEWLSNGVTVTGAVKSTLLLSKAELRKRISCTVTARNAVGFAVGSSHAVKVTASKEPPRKKPRTIGGHHS
jgi:uncharacterized delta-60 repeat protein